MSILDKFSLHGKVAIVTGGNEESARASRLGLPRPELPWPSSRETRK